MADGFDTIRTDETLIDSVKRHSEDGWAKFYDCYAVIILNFARKLGCLEL